MSTVKVYVVDGSRAALDFPNTELYLAFDGGSGCEFWLPHLAPHDIEGPNKLIEKHHTSPFKVMNGQLAKQTSLNLRAGLTLALHCV